MPFRRRLPEPASAGAVAGGGDHHLAVLFLRFCDQFSPAGHLFVSPVRRQRAISCKIFWNILVRTDPRSIARRRRLPPGQRRRISTAGRIFQRAARRRVCCRFRDTPAQLTSRNWTCAYREHRIALSRCLAKRCRFRFLYPAIRLAARCCIQSGAFSITTQQRAYVTWYSRQHGELL